MSNGSFNELTKTSKIKGNLLALYSTLFAIMLALAFLRNDKKLQQILSSSYQRRTTAHLILYWLLSLIYFGLDNRVG